MKIVISPYSAKLRSGKPNPKNYPHWRELVNLLSGCEITQVGVRGEEQFVKDFRTNLPFPKLQALIESCDTWIAVDNFLQHFVNTECNQKPGVVLWSQSDPKIFGYDYNTNLLRDPKYLRQHQFDTWEVAEFVPDAFVKPWQVVSAIFAKDMVLETPIYNPMFDI